MIEELLKFVEIKEGKEDELTEFLAGKMISPDSVKRYLESDDGYKNILKPLNDKHFNKAIETWKQNNLESIVEDELVKRNPGETEDQKRIRKLEQKLQEAETKERRMRLESYAKETALQKGIPTDIVGYFVADDEETTDANLETLSRTLSEMVQLQVKNRFKEGGRTVTTNKGTTVGELSRLREEYEKAVEQNKPLPERVRLTRLIQEAEQQ